MAKYFDQKNISGNILNTNNLLPALTFIFSRKQCYIWASKVQRSLFDENSTIRSSKKHENSVLEPTNDFLRLISSPKRLPNIF